MILHFTKFSYRIFISGRDIALDFLTANLSLLIRIVATDKRLHRTNIVTRAKSPSLFQCASSANIFHLFQYKNEAANHVFLYELHLLIICCVDKLLSCSSHISSSAGRLKKSQECHGSFDPRPSRPKSFSNVPDKFPDGAISTSSKY